MSDIDEIKTRLDIVSYIGKTVTLKKAGRNFKGLCPFHKEKTPSFMVSPDRQSFHCFGCGAGGSVFDFVMKLHHVEFTEALEDLADEAGVKLTKIQGESPQDKLKQALYAVNEKAADYYKYILTKHPLGQKAMLYLKNRGISDKSITTFGIGYSPNSWDALTTYLRKKGFDNKIIQSAGLSIEGNRGLYDRFRGRIMFPLRDPKGRTVAFSGRVLDPGIKEAKYINTSETPIYIKGNMLYGLDVTRDAIGRENQVIVMEGEIDVISSFQEGVSSVVAIKGSALTEAHIQLIKRYCQRIVFCLDSDVAGDAAARRGIELADEAGLDMRVIELPVGKDPDEAVRTDPIGFKKAVDQAVPIYDYFLKSASGRFQLTDPYGKKQASDELMQMLLRISNPIIQAHYIKKVARMLDVTEETVVSGMKKVRMPIGTKRGDSKTPQETTVINPRMRAEEYIVSLLLAGDVISKLSIVRSIVDMVTDVSIRRILEELIKYADANTEKPIDIAAFADILPSELIPVFDQAYLRDLSEIVQDPQDAEEELEKTIQELKRTTILELIRKKTTAMNQVDCTDDQTEKLSKEVSELTAQLKALEKS